MGDSHQPNSEPPRKSVIIILAAIVLVLGVILVLVLRPSSLFRSKTETATDESAQSVSPAAPEAPPAAVPPREVIASAPVSAVPPIAQPQTAPQASPYARQLVNALVQLNMTNGALTPEKLAAWHRAAADAQPEPVQRVALSPEVREVIAGKNGLAAQRLTASKARVELPLLAQLRTLEDSIQQDTIRNEQDLHRQLHTWFAQRQVGDLNSFNDRVYAQLFLTPRSDPWLGLMPPDVYSGIENDGLARR